MLIAVILCVSCFIIIIFIPMGMLLSLHCIKIFVIFYIPLSSKNTVVSAILFYLEHTFIKNFYKVLVYKY